MFSSAMSSEMVRWGRSPSASDTSPNCRSRSTSSTRPPVAWARYAATLVAKKVLPQPPGGGLVYVGKAAEPGGGHLLRGRKNPVRRLGVGRLEEPRRVVEQHDLGCLVQRPCRTLDVADELTPAVDHEDLQGSLGRRLVDVLVVGRLVDVLVGVGEGRQRGPSVVGIGSRHRGRLTA